MKNKGIGFGIFLVVIGIIWTLISLGFITWSVFGSLVTLWPLILVVIGINLIFSKNSIIRIITWLLFIIIVVVYGYFWRDKVHVDNYETTDISELEHMSLEKFKETQDGELKMSVGALKFNIGQTDSMLIDANFDKNLFDYEVKYKNNNETANIDIETRKNFILNSDKLNNSLNLNLNKDIVWKLKLEAGASSGTVDMTDLKIKDLEMNVGAATESFQLVFGNNYKDTNVKIDTGVSSFDVDVPKESGVKIKLDGGLNSTNLDDGPWIKDGKYYMTDNYNSSDSKIYMDVDMGVGSFNVNFK